MTHDGRFDGSANWWDITGFGCHHRLDGHTNGLDIAIPLPEANMKATRVRRTALVRWMLVLILMTAPLWLFQAEAAQIPVRFAEGVTHGFLLLTTTEGKLIATGDLLQVPRGNTIESRMVFRFKDGSLYDETVVFTQQRVFAMQSYHLVQRGPAYAEDTEISFRRPSGKYHVITKSHKDAREEAIDGTLAMPPDVYNGMVLTVVKNLSKDASTTVKLVAFTPKPMVIELVVEPAGEHTMEVGLLTKTAVHYVLKPHMGAWFDLFAKLLGRMPEDYHVWLITDGAPAFARFEGALNPTGPVWRIELTSPHWPE
jgi:hypothetical protein